MAITRSQRKTLIGVFLLITVTYLISVFIRKDINENAEYTVAFVYDYMDGPSSGPAVFFYYYVNGKKFKNSDYLNTEYNVKIEEFYLVKYSSKNPMQSELQQHQQVTDTNDIVAAGLSLPKIKKNQFQE